MTPFKPSEVPYADLAADSPLLLSWRHAKEAARYVNSTRRGEKWRAERLKGVVVAGSPAGNLVRLR